MPSDQKLHFPTAVLAGSGNLRLSAVDRLIEENHQRNRLLYKGVLHNHVQHGVLAAYYLGADEESLQEIFKDEAEELEMREVMMSSEDMTEEAVDKFLGHLDHELDYVNYFEKERAEAASAGKLNDRMQYWLLDRQNPFLPGLIGGYGHPFKLLGDAVDLGNSTLTFDVLALIAIDWSPLNALVTVALPEPRFQPGSLTHLLDAIRNDPVFTDVVTKPGIASVSDILHHKDAAGALLQYISMGNSYLLQSEVALGVTQEMVEIAVQLLTCAHAAGKPTFDFFLGHNLTFVHCLHTLLPIFQPLTEKKSLVRVYLLLTVLAFITQGRPQINLTLLNPTSEQSSMTWEDVKKAAIGSGNFSKTKRNSEPHFLKVVQLMHRYGSLMPRIEPMLLAAASKFVTEFSNWVGFPAS